MEGRRWKAAINSFQNRIQDNGARKKARFPLQVLIGQLSLGVV